MVPERVTAVVCAWDVQISGDLATKFCGAMLRVDGGIDIPVALVSIEELPTPDSGPQIARSRIRLATR